VRPQQIADFAPYRRQISALELRAAVTADDRCAMVCSSFN